MKFQRRPAPPPPSQKKPAITIIMTIMLRLLLPDIYPTHLPPSSHLFTRATKTLTTKTTDLCQLSILIKFLSHCVSSSQLSPSRCTGTTTTMERYVFKIMSTGEKWIKLFLSSEKVAIANHGLAVFFEYRKGSLPWKVASKTIPLKNLNYLQAKVGRAVCQ